MGMKIEGDTITCDCGFSFLRGHSGKHECAEGLRAKLAAAVRREEGMKAIVDVMGLRITELDQQLQQPAPTVSFYRDGIMDAAKWVDQQREAYDNEHGRHDPDTGSFEFGNSAQEEHSSTLQDIADGIRSLHPYAKNTAPAVPEDVATAIEWIDDFIARCNGDDRGACNSVNVLRAAMLQPVSQGYTLNSAVIPDGCSAKSPYAAAAVPTDQLINIANHIAGSAGALPGEWQDWASELVSDLRRLAASKVDPVVPGDAEFNAWVHDDYNRGVTLSCPVNLGIARSAWKGCCAAMLATVPDEIDIFVDQVCGNLPAGHQQ